MTVVYDIIHQKRSICERQFFRDVLLITLKIFYRDKHLVKTNSKCSQNELSVKISEKGKMTAKRGHGARSLFSY